MSDLHITYKIIIIFRKITLQSKHIWVFFCFCERLHARMCVINIIILLFIVLHSIHSLPWRALWITLIVLLTLIVDTQSQIWPESIRIDIDSPGKSVTFPWNIKFQFIVCLFASLPRWTIVHRKINNISALCSQCSANSQTIVSVCTNLFASKIFNLLFPISLLRKSIIDWGTNLCTILPLSLSFYECCWHLITNQLKWSFYFSLLSCSRRPIDWIGIRKNCGLATLDYCKWLKLIGSPI